MPIRGDVVIVNFPQAPGQPPKRRPALVVQSDHNNTRLSNTIVVMITSNTSLASKEPTQFLIEVSTAHGKQAGLLRDSAVKCENIYTLPSVSIVRTIGSLPATAMQEVDACLKASLALA